MLWCQRSLGSERQFQGRCCRFPSRGTAGPPRETPALEPQLPPQSHGHGHGPGTVRQLRHQAQAEEDEAPALQTTLWLSLEKHVGPRMSLTPAPCSQLLGTCPKRRAFNGLPPRTPCQRLGASPQTFQNRRRPRKQGAPLSEAVQADRCSLHHRRSFSAPPRTAPVTPLMLGMCSLNTHHSLWGQVCN